MKKCKIICNTFICFDTDGTLKTPEMENEGEYVKGVIDQSILEYLWNNKIAISIVSESPFYPKTEKGEPRFHVHCGKSRAENLIDATNCYIEYIGKEPNLKLYVSDNGDYKEAEKAGFIYIDAKMFANGFKKK